jgi:hypothetical protein
MKHIEQLNHSKMMIILKLPLVELFIMNPIKNK